MWCNAWSLKIILTKTHPKILTKTQKFEKSQTISKTPKVRSKIMKMHDKDEEKDHTRWGTKILRPKMKWGRWKAWVLGDWKKERSLSIERDQGE